MLAVTYLCFRVTKATASYEVKFNRVIGYLAGTPELGKRLGGDENDILLLVPHLAMHPSWFT